MKQQSITFEYRPNSIEASKDKTPYKLLKLTNSVEYHPGSWYDKSTVKNLCFNRKWNVTIVAE